ncbi:MaoC family dehydratase [Halosolutus amylolyticus]|uniref:MaoC family dehydratase n=1 Tax=Halosolutus amylolyticus TaxID=2932267 RepID=A0ABD5PID5_9EURY|nr:MaoC family dehydratase [Halosolutus amylolyticus]
MRYQARGKYYEELEVGDIYEHRPGRTMTEFDNTLWTLSSLNMQPLHLDRHFAEETEFGERLMNSMFTLSVVVGAQVTDLTMGTTVANLGFEEISFPRPVFVGDTVYSETEIIDKRTSESRDDSGIVTFEHRGINQDGETVCSCTRVALMKHAPDAADLQT